jgi:hypothetical protein
MRRWLKWVGLALFALLSLVYVYSVQFRTGYQGGFLVALNRGCIDFCPKITSLPTNFADRAWFDESRTGLSVTLWPEVNRFHWGKTYRIPLWFVMVPLAAGTIVLWYRDRSRPGHCQACGYDLTDNVSGRCPECGEET